MRIPKRGEKGFTLIELLIVVAILGVLAAVVIPNVGRFMGRGEEEARRVEYNTVRTAVTAMMVENDLTVIPTPSHPYTVAGPGATDDATNDMSIFPDASVCETDKLIDPDGYYYLLDTVTPFDTDGDGYVLYGHDITGSGTVANPGANPSTTNVNTVSTRYMTYYYTCNAAGEIQQFNMADLDHADIEEYTY